jgi:ubiquinone/menaquinone biosynthesis C-methylase UbiE
LNLANKRAYALDMRNCILLQGDVFNSPFQSGQFHGIFCWDLLGHIKDVRRAITELIRICRPGGCIVGSLFATSDPNRGMEMVAVSDNEFIYKEKFYYRFYSKVDVERLLQEFPVRLSSLSLEEWEEPGHEGFREYRHTHQSWAFTLEKGLI